MAVGAKLVGVVTGIVARKVSMKALDSAWKRTRASDPPADPASPLVPWRDALSWAAASGVAVGVSRLVAQRGIASAKAKVTGRVPEGMEGPGGRTRVR